MADRRCLTAAASVLAMACAGPVNAALTEGPRLAAVYDAILDARFEQVDAQLKQACPPAPEGACQALLVVSLSWQILINPESRLLDQRFAELAASTIAANDAWVQREPLRAEAWFYLAGTYAPRAQWRVLRGERLGAAIDGESASLKRAPSICTITRPAPAHGRSCSDARSAAASTTHERQKSARDWV